MSNCDSLTKLSNSFSNFANLEEEHLKGCVIFQKLPPCISGLKMLRFLQMKNMALENLPKDFGQLLCLTKVPFNGCKKLQSLCENFNYLEGLKFLDLFVCESLMKLQNSFSELSNLEVLFLNGCIMLHKIPPFISRLKKWEYWRKRIQHGRTCQRTLNNFKAW